MEMDDHNLLEPQFSHLQNGEIVMTLAAGCEESMKCYIQRAYLSVSFLWLDGGRGKVRRLRIRAA